MMIKIDAIVREEKFEDVKQALQDIEVNGITVSAGNGVWCSTRIHRNRTWYGNWDSNETQNKI